MEAHWGIIRWRSSERVRQQDLIEMKAYRKERRAIASQLEKPRSFGVCTPWELKATSVRVPNHAGFLAPSIDLRDVIIPIPYFDSF